MNLILMGLRGSGKSTVGRLVAQRLDKPFVDLDDVTPTFLGGGTVREVWEKHGEPAFRAAELKALQQVLQKEDQVIALGGGTPTAKGVPELLREVSTRDQTLLIYLAAKAETLRRHLEQSGLVNRPSLTGRNPLAEIEDVLRAREPVYADLADAIVMIDDLDLDRVGDRIVEASRASTKRTTGSNIQSNTNDQRAPLPYMTYEVWRELCFTAGHEDFHGRGDPSPVMKHALAIEHAIPDELRAAHLVRLFRESSTLVERYTTEQVAGAVWYIFGCGSETLGAVQSATVPVALQIKVYEALPELYLGLFDKLCDNRGAFGVDRASPPDDALDTAIYMIWDMDYLESVLYQPDRYPHLVDPALNALRRILLSCRASACVWGAMHALGHIQCHHQRAPSIADRINAMIDEFIHQRGSMVASWLTDYAAQARDGTVQ